MGNACKSSGGRFAVGYDRCSKPGIKRYPHRRDRSDQVQFPAVEQDRLLPRRGAEVLVGAVCGGEGIPVPLSGLKVRWGASGINLTLLACVGVN